MGFLGALLGAAPTVLGGIAKGKRDREQTEYTRNQAAMEQAAQENARQQAMAQAMQEFQARQEDTRATREMTNEYRKSSLAQTKALQDEERQRRVEATAANVAQRAEDRTERERQHRAQIALGYAGIAARNTPQDNGVARKQVRPGDSTKLSEKMAMLNQVGQAIQDYQGAVQSGQNLGGPIDQYLLKAGDVTGFSNPDARAKRANMAMQTAKINHAMSGANFTAAEAERNKSYTVTPADKETVAIDKLKSLYQNLYNDLENQMNGWEDAGFDTEAHRQRLSSHPREVSGVGKQRKPLGQIAPR